jgi:membrane protein DedA with SNARE-associated domain
VVTGGNLANQGLMALPLVILAGFIGAILGDNAAYWLGRAGGDRIHRFFRRLVGPDRVAAADRMVIERGPVLVTAGRFLPGIRLAINLACGAGHMTWKRFVTFNSLGAIIWSVQAAMLGYAFGTLFQDKHWLGLLVAIGVSLVVGGLVGLYEHRKVRHTNAIIAAEKATAGGESDA